MSGFFGKLRRSERWPWAVVALAVLVLAGGTAAALIIRHVRSTSREESLDLYAVRDITGDIATSTCSLAEEWRSPTLPGNADYLVILQQEAQAALQVEMARGDSLYEELHLLDNNGGEAQAKKADDALASLAEAQFLLGKALEKAGMFLDDLDGIIAADACYERGYQSLITAVEHHNQAAAADPPDFSSARQEANSALASLQEAETLIQSSEIEGLDLEASLAAINELKVTTEKFIEACQKAESGDAEGHNNMMDEVKAGLSSTPVSILESLDTGSWLRANLEEYLEPVFSKIDETRSLLEEI